MNQYDGTAERAWLTANIEAYLDGDLRPADALRFRKGRVLVSEDLERAMKLKRALGDLSSARLSEGATARVLKEAHERDRLARGARFREALRRRWTGSLKPAFSAAALVLLVLLSTRIETPSQPTDAEVRQALTEVRWALGIVGEAGRQAGSVVRDEALPDGAARQSAVRSPRSNNNVLK